MTRPTRLLVVAACLASCALPASAAQRKLTTDHWSFQPVVRPVPPTVRDTAWVRNPIDAFILAKLEAKGLKPSPRADRVTLARRMSLVMHGLPASPQAIAAFKNDKRPDAYARLVERTLASPHYGERFARHWLDLARYADTNGFETNTPRPNAWRYRDWVIAAFNNDLPYDRFVIAQLAGDSVGHDAATGFIVAGPYDQVKSPDINLTLMQREDELADMVNAASTAFLGLTVACARCHDHKFDPIPQEDYYAFKAVFTGVRHGDRAIPLDSSDETKAKVASLRQQLKTVNTELAKVEPAPLPPVVGRTIVIDDEDVTSDAKTPGVSLLATKRGHGVNPGGVEKGFRDDPGDHQRLPNVSRGRYTWWEGVTNKPVFAYHPRAEGRFRLWLSWGCGWHTHSTDVRYVLDTDGNPTTTDDQRLLATINQQRMADGEHRLVSKPLWSGFRDGGEVALQASSSILVIAGKEPRPVSADMIVLQEVEEGATPPAVALPRLRSAVDAAFNEERFPAVKARFIRFTTHATNNGSEPCIDELELFTPGPPGSEPRNVARQPGVKLTSSGDYQGNPKHKLEHINDGQYGNDRSWISNTGGKGWVQLELPKAETIGRIAWARDRQKRYNDRLPTTYSIEVANEPGQWRVVATGGDRLPFGKSLRDVPAYRFASLSADEAKAMRSLLAKRKDLQAQVAELTKPITAYAGTFSKPETTHVLYRGDPMAKRDPVAPDALTVTGSLGLKLDEPERQRRHAFAKWVAQKDNPLTARVMVNRIWAWHFGQGIVNTPSDFGDMGAKPTHAQLLDWLASEFVRSGWSVKHIQRLILTSATWQQSSAPRNTAIKVDAGSTLLWRFPPRRVDAETLRDSVLATTGVLDTRMGGPGFDTFKPNTNYVRNYIPKETFGPAEWRRMVYMYRVRMETDATFGVFDCPDAGQAAAERAVSTTALQAMSLLNSPFMMQQADLYANRIKKEAGDDLSQQVDRAFELSFGRQPSAQQRAGAMALAHEHGLASLCRALLNANEFLFIP